MTELGLMTGVTSVLGLTTIFWLIIVMAKQSITVTLPTLLPFSSVYATACRDFDNHFTRDKLIIKMTIQI